MDIKKLIEEAVCLPWDIAVCLPIQYVIVLTYNKQISEYLIRNVKCYKENEQGYCGRKCMVWIQPIR